MRSACTAAREWHPFAATRGSVHTATETSAAKNKTFKNCLKKKISFVVFIIIRVYFLLSILFLRLVCASYLGLCQINLNLVRVPIFSYLGVCVRQFHRVYFLFSLKVSWYQIWDFRFLIVILNFLIESWFFLKLKLESGFWLNIIHVSLCLVSFSVSFERLNFRF